MGKHWLDGIWFFEDFKFVLHEVKGETAWWKNISCFDHPDVDVPKSFCGSWTYGDFGETTKEIKEASGADRYNVQMIYWTGKINMKGVVSEDGKSMHLMGMLGGLAHGKCVSQDEFKAIMDDREHTNDMSCFYEKQPENQGKLLWLSGPPGAGKSTTGQLLAKEHGYVYFEADCFMNMINPYIPLDAAEPSLAQMNQKGVTGVSDETFRKLVKGLDEFPKMMDGLEYDPDIMGEWYEEMAKDILKEKNKIGGTWAVAQAVPTRAMRDKIKNILGDQCIFVTLHLSEETNAKRVEQRHGGESMDPEMKKMIAEMLNKMYAIFEIAQPDEDNAVNVEIGPDMGKVEVAKMILSKVQKWM